MVERLIEIADGLTASHPRSSAARRRAVSTAYYAAFHALARACADQLLPESDRASAEYERVYRALEHAALRRVFNPKDRAVRKRLPLPLQRIGDSVFQLQSERFRADYLPPIAGVFTRTESEELVEQARSVVRELAALEAQDRMLLATHLLFKDPRQ